MGIMKKSILIQEMSEILKSKYDYISKLDSIKYLKPLYSHNKNLRIGDYVTAQILAFQH